ncbi:MAG: HD family hydrolase [Arenibacterium sp.]
MTDRLSRQIAFLSEADQLKSVTRANVLTDNSRAENSAEHAWHVALFALVFADRVSPDDLNRALQMILLHDLVEIDAGDHPIDQIVDAPAIAAAEAAAADRIFGLLPPDQARAFQTLWTEFEDGQTDAAGHAKACDHIQPIFQATGSRPTRDDHLQIVRDNITTGRAARFDQEWPAIATAAQAHLNGSDTKDPRLSAQLAFLREVDKLKSVLRASRLLDNSRHENSAEHSWHIMLYAFVLADQAGANVDISRVLKMLLLHDIVEIDAGDAPIHGVVDHEAMAAKEAAAADRLFGLLPADQAAEFHTIWTEFETAESPEAKFAKAVDRFQTPIANLANGGGTWAEYSVTLAQLDARVGTPVRAGAPGLWAWLLPKLKAHFSEQA